MKLVLILWEVLCDALVRLMDGGVTRSLRGVPGYSDVPVRCSSPTRPRVGPTCVEALCRGSDDSPHICGNEHITDPLQPALMDAHYTWRWSNVLVLGRPVISLLRPMLQGGISSAVTICL